MNETIVAISTPLVSGPIGIIRLSGKDTAKILNEIVKPNSNKLFSEINPREMTLCKVFSRQNQVIDEPLCVYFKGKNTFTGEDMAELHLHGSLAVLDEVLKNILSKGAMMAEPGEFTKRAFIAGKIDLSKAEAIHDLVESNTLELAINSANQLVGVVGSKITEIREKIVSVIAHFHAVVDYPDEDIDPFLYEEASEIMKNSSIELFALAKSYEQGKILKEGVDCTILGKPNVGKSSILNALSGTEKAIVTPIAGTTRDIVEGYIKAGPLVLKLSDTAGLRTTNDEVEKIGVERAIKSADNAKIVLVVFDGSEDLSDEDLMAIARTVGKKTVAIINKMDLDKKIDMENIKTYFENIVEVSAKDQQNISKITDKILEILNLADINFDGEIITNARQAAAITRAGEICEYAHYAAESGMTPDTITMDAESAMSALDSVTGRNIHDDVLNNIFSNFCVGK